MNRRILTGLSIVFGAIFMFSAVLLSINLYNRFKHAGQSELLVSIAESGQTEKALGIKEIIKKALDMPAAESFQAPQTEQEQLENYQKLKEINHDFVGWLKLENTSLNYPVMQSKEKPDFYINHDFYKNVSSYGALYVSENCGLSGSQYTNTVIYGHNMRDKSMFGILGEYADKSFYEQHKQIRFDTVSESAVYDIVGFFEINLIDDDFHYYEYTDLDKELFDMYIDNVKSRAFYETDATAVYGRRLLTLSTCHSYKENVRLVLVAQKVELSEI